MIPQLLQSNARFGQGIPALPGLEFSKWEDFQKAVVAGYGSDSAALTGGGALRIESLERTLMSVVQTHEHFVLFNRLKKSPATATVDEWTEKNAIGGRAGGSFNSETGNIKEVSGKFKRRVAQVKYLMTKRSVTVVQAAMNTIVSAKSEEEVNGTLQLLSDAEWASFYGNSAVVPEEFDGIETIIRNLNSIDHIIDAEGKPMDQIGFEDVLSAAATAYGFGNFGKISDIFLSTLAQTDLDLRLDPAFRVPLPADQGGTTYGSPVVGLRTSFGNIKTNPDVFVQEGGIPPQSEPEPAHTTTNPTKPQSVTAVAADETTSKFGAAHAGNYYWGVSSVSKEGESDITLTTQTAVASGKKVTLTITAPAAGDATGYKIYRSRKNGTNAPADMRFMFRVPDSGSATTVYVDLNREIPGTSRAFLLNMNPTFEAIGWRQMLPLTRFQLYPTVSAIDPWAMLLFGYLRVTKERQHLMIKNILPNVAKKRWDPFA